MPDGLHPWGAASSEEPLGIPSLGTLELRTLSYRDSIFEKSILGGWHEWELHPWGLYLGSSHP
jgi:hypothetical protein